MGLYFLLGEIRHHTALSIVGRCFLYDMNFCSNYRVMKSYLYLNYYDPNYYKVIRSLLRILIATIYKIQLLINY